MTEVERMYVIVGSLMAFLGFMYAMINLEKLFRLLDEEEHLIVTGAILKGMVGTAVGIAVVVTALLVF